MPASLQDLLIPLLGSSVSMGFVVLVFILGEYSRMSEENYSPNIKRPYWWGGIAVLSSVILSSIAIFLLGISFSTDFDLVCTGAVFFFFQLLVLLGAAIGITHEVLVSG